MKRKMVLALAVPLTLAAAPAAAAPFYAAEPAAAPSQSRMALRDTMWRCDAGTCSAAVASASRPAIVCAVLADKVGELRSFSVRGQALPAADLQKCNARAKKAADASAQAASR